MPSSVLVGRAASSHKSRTCNHMHFNHTFCHNKMWPKC
jgi:hypothetical protein